MEWNERNTKYWKYKKFGMKEGSSIGMKELKILNNLVQLLNIWGTERRRLAQIIRKN